jgi:hypothetical protein
MCGMNLFRKSRTKQHEATEGHQKSLIHLFSGYQNICLVTILYSVQTSFGAQPAFHTMGTRGCADHREVLTDVKWHVHKTDHSLNLVPGSEIVEIYVYYSILLHAMCLTN